MMIRNRLFFKPVYLKFLISQDILRTSDSFICCRT